MPQGSKLTGFIFSSSFGFFFLSCLTFLVLSIFLTIIFVKDGFTSNSFFLFSSRSFLEAANKKEASFG